MNITLKPGTPVYKKVLDALEARKKLWYRDSADRRAKWERDIEQHQLYVHESEDDRLRRAQADATKKTDYARIVVPYSYGLLMAFHTYLSSVFLARSPVLQFQERHGETADSVQSLEAIMSYQTNIGGHLPVYYVWLMDAAKHGAGVVGTYWADETIRVSKIVEEDAETQGFFTRKRRKRKVKRTVEVPAYQGNRLYNVRPHHFIFDTRVPLAQFQEGEFAGRILNMSMLDVEEGAASGRYMNIDALKRSSGNGTTFTRDTERDDDESVIDLPNPTESSDVTNIPGTGRGDGYELIVRLVPKNWGLGSSTRVEKWAFTVLNRVIIEARPLGELHDKFPFGVIETEIDGHVLFKRSLLEITEPLNNVMSWLVNTHFFNIRKSLNNMFVADPSRIYTGDFKNPEEGLMIRMRPEAYGQPIGNFIKQFETRDVTQTHMNDTKIIAELMQQVTGVNSQLMGMLQVGGRRTATEVRGSTGFSMNRLKTQAEWISASGFAPLAQMLVQSTQQHLSVERKYRLTGDLLPGTDRFVSVSPESIAGFYDYIPVDGTMPVDKLALANLWKELMMGISQDEQLKSRYDIGAIFAYIAQLSGAKNISRFKIQTMDDAEIQRQRDAGNLVPIGGQQNAGRFNAPRGADDGRIEAGAARVNEPTQIPGVGPLS